MPGVRWFPGATLNYAEQALAPGASRPDAIAVIAISQTRDTIELTWDHLALGVRRCAAALRQLGVGAGDRVVAYAPNIPETLVAFLATASLGAIWSSCAPEFGVRSVIDRFAQIEPAVLVAVDGYRYGGKDIDRRDHVAEIVAALPTLRHVVHIPYLDRHRHPPPAPAMPEQHTWDELLLGAPAEPLSFTPVAADHPLYVLFSSGTTGLPKAIVHGHGGIVAEHLKVLTFHQDLTPADRFFWFTTTGWMMWNYLVSGLLDRLDDRAVRRRPGVARAEHALERRRRHRHDRVRVVGAVPDGVPQGRRQAAAERAALGRLDRRAAAG